MKRSVYLFLALALCLSLFAGCSGQKTAASASAGTASAASASTAAASASSAAASAGSAAASAGTSSGSASSSPDISGELEVAAFSNGELYDKFWNTAVEEFNKLYPNCKVTLVLSSNIEESMRPRFVSGDAPDIYWMSGQADVDEAPLTAEGKFMDLTDWYNSVEAIGYDGLLKDNISIEMFNRANGGIYGMGFCYGCWGCLYNQSMTEQYGWTPPTNWKEFETLAATIKSASSDIYPMIHQGIYPDYVGFGLMQPGIATDGGKQILVDEGNLKSEAYDEPAVVNAWTKLEEVRDNDWSPQYCLSLSHTEAQMMWLQGKAFLLPCGNWLEGEMADSMPDGFKVGFIPSFWHDSTDTPTMVANSARVSVSADTKNPDAALAFLQVLFSKNMTRAVVECDLGIPCMKDSLDGMELSQENQQVLDLVNQGKVNVICEIGGSGNFEPYGEQRTVIKNNIAAILSGDEDAKTALTNVKTEIDRIRNDSSIEKIPISVS